MRKILFVPGLFLLLAACKDYGHSNYYYESPPKENRISSGLKIFVTARKHVGDFANDTTLTGDNGIEKADHFCNTDPNKPNDSVYKALLVDGYNRDAVSSIDWVLLPNTTYYRPYDRIEIGTTGNLAIFNVVFQDLTNSIAPPNRIDDTGYVWTGIANPLDFAAGESCDSWGNINAAIGHLGIWHQNNRAAFKPDNIAGSSCNGSQRLYCVEQ